MVASIVLATRNSGKIKEFERLLAEYIQGVRVLGLSDFPEMPDVEETGDSFIANSLLKAREVSAFANLPALADDSGLCVDYLHGAPGIYSARYSGVHGDDQANIEKLLRELDQIPAPGRTAHFTCSVACVFPPEHPLHEQELIEQAHLEGSIVTAPRGSAGFGYDPIFLPKGYQLTLGEFGPGEKDAISHRGKAMRAIAPKISALLS
jgi:XTP/dITP diphosphohydrolase